MCMRIVKRKILKTHLSLSDIYLLTELPQALLKLKFFTKLHKCWIYKSHLVNKWKFKLFTTRELQKRILRILNLSTIFTVKYHMHTKSISKDDNHDNIYKNNGYNNR